MDKNNIIIKLDSVCQALNNVTVTGIQNMGNIAGCYSILQEIRQEITSDLELSDE